MPLRDATSDSASGGEPRQAIPFPGMPPAAVIRSFGSSGDSRSRDPTGAAERRVPGDGESYRDANGNGLRPPTSQSGELRRTLHLSPGDGGAAAGEPHQLSPAPISANRGERPAPDAATFRPALGDFHSGNGNGSARPVSIADASQRSRIETEDRRQRESFIDQDLRKRVEGDIGAFLAAFDAALSEDSIETRAGLREATDRLLRAGARTRIELERLEARVPLPTRDIGAREQYSWRSR